MKERTTSGEAEPVYLTVPEAAKALGCHVNTIRAMIRKEKLSPVYFGDDKVPMINEDQISIVRKTLERKGNVINENEYGWPIVAVGASAGGLDALKALVSHLPESLGLPYVLISHTKPGGGQLLAEILSKFTSIPIVLAEKGMKLSPDRIHVIPGGVYASVVDSTFKLNSTAGEKGARYPIDHFFRSMAKAYRSNAIGIILSGTGSDGTDGARAIKAEDGIVIVQDDSAAEQSMPGTAIRSGVVDMVRAPAAMGRELSRILQQLYPEKGKVLPRHEEDVRRILHLIYERKGIDFSQYKQATVDRRVIRRMILAHCDDLKAYTKLLEEMPTEIETLINDLLINVTSFFRDQKLFAELARSVLPDLLKDRRSKDPIRIWIPACAGGEEVVSIAITLLEVLGERAMSTQVQIFATDLNERTIEKARLGIYKSGAVNTLSPERVRRFFIPVDGHYQVIKTIRDMCVFARHDLLKDPPFSRLDLISCQNVLIYMENSAQAHVLRSFHYALNQNGYLLLGKAETTVPVGDIFIQPSREHRIYRRRIAKGERPTLDLPINRIPLTGPATGPLSAAISNSKLTTDIDGEVDQLLLQKYGPPGVVINKDLKIVSFRGNTSAYLSPATGKASLLLLKMVRNEIATELRPMLYRARREKIPVSRHGIPVEVKDRTVDLGIDVIPITPRNDPHFLVIFRELAELPQKKIRKRGSTGDATEPFLQRIEELEEQLREVREQMRLVAEESESANQDLQAANEEIVSANEELQSINEELETSKEELQSINEEFATINEELQARNDALRESEERLRLATRTGRVGIWDRDLAADHITWSDALFDMFGISRDHFDPTWKAFISRILPEDRDVVKKTLEKAIEKETRFQLEFRALRADGTMRWLFTNGIVVQANGNPVRMLGAILDITDLKRTELALKQRTQTLELLNRVGDDLIADLDPDSIIQRVVDAALEITNASNGVLLHRVTGNGSSEDIHHVKANGSESTDFPLSADMANLSNKWGGLGLQRIADIQKQAAGRKLPKGDKARSHLSVPVLSRDGAIIGGLFLSHGQPDHFTQEDADAISALTAQAALALDNAQLHTALIKELEEQKRIEAELRESRERYQELVEMMPVGVYACDANGTITLYNQAIAHIWGREPKVGKEQWCGASKLFKIDGTRVPIQECAMARTVHTGKAIADVEVIVERPNGERRHIIANPTPVFDSNGKLTGALNVLIDVTDKKRAEAEREKLSGVLEKSLNEIYIFDLETFRFEYVNNGALQNMGYSLEEMKEMTPVDIKPHFTQVEFQNYVEPLRNGSKSKLLFHTVHRRANGTDYPVEVHLQCVHDGEKKVFLAMILDITDRRENEERLRVATATGKLGIWDWDVEQDTIAWTDPVYEIHGVRKGEFEPTLPGYTQLIHPEDRERVGAAIQKALQNDDAYEIEFRTLNSDGEINWVFTNAVVLRDNDRPVRMLGGTMNITERKHAEEDARKLAAIVESSQDAILSADLEGKLTSWNSAAERIYGYSAEEVIGKSIEFLLPPERKQEARIEIERLQNGERLQSFESKRLRKDGKLVDLAITVSPINAEDGRLIGISKIAHDITDRIQAEEERRESEERFQLLADNMDQLAWIGAADGSTMWFNKRWEEFSGIPVDEIRDRAATDLHHPDHYPGVVESLTASAAKGEAWEYIFPLKRKDGEWRWFLSRAIPVHDHNGVIFRWFGTSTDITEQREIQEVLQKSEERFHLLADTMDQLAYVADPDGSLVWYNKRWYEFTGTTPGETAGDGWTKVVSGDELEKIMANWMQAVKSGTPFEMELTLKNIHDGTSGYFLSRASPARSDDGRILQWFGTLTDITAIKEAASSLRDSEGRLRAVFEQSAAGFALTDTSGKFIEVNQYFSDSLQYSMEELQTMRMQDVTHADDLPRNKELFQQSVREGIQFDIEKRYVRKDGSTMWVHVSVSPIRNSDGEVGRILGVSVDLTERKRAEALLRESEARFRQMADSAPVLIWISDTEKKTIWFNKPWLDFVGRPMEKELGFGWADNVHPDDKERCLEVFKMGFDARVPFTMDYRLRRHDGEYRWIFDHGTPIHDGDGNFRGYIGSCMDIHTRKEAEQALAEAARQKDQFLATLAHELRNPLAPIRNGLQLLEIAGKDEELHRSTRAMMDRQMNHLVRLVDDLMDLSRISRGKIELRPENVDLATIVETAVESSRPLIESRKHELIVQLPKRSLMVFGDAMRLTQSIANLVNNAAKYTPTGGRIEVTLEKKDGHGVIRVKDNGIGIDPEVLPSVFEMFTQIGSDQKTDPGGGLGIGLNIVERLSQMHGGTVHGHSEGKGKGCEFVIALPLRNGEQKPLEPTTPSGVSSNGKAQRILVVDDNHDAAMSMGLLLRKQGHDVHLAHDGLQAVRMAEELLPDVIFMDIGMPLMNGFEACEYLRSQPWGTDLFIVALTGWGQQRDVERSDQAGFNTHFVKPISPTDLEQLLDHKQSARTPRPGMKGNGIA